MKINKVFSIILLIIIIFPIMAFAQEKSEIRDQLASADSELNKTLIDSLNNLTSIVINATPAEFVDSAASVKSLLDKAIIIVLPENEIADIKLNMSTLINLLKTVASEYEVGKSNGTITNISEYQNPHGSVSFANELLNKTTNSLNQTLASNLTKIKDSLQEINATSNNKDPRQISTIFNNITNTILNRLSIQPEDLVILVSTDTESSELINNITTLLDQTIEKSKNSNYQNAESLATIESHLDNFK
jgi:hypothetical protein